MFEADGAKFYYVLYPVVCFAQPPLLKHGMHCKQCGKPVAASQGQCISSMSNLGLKCIPATFEKDIYNFMLALLMT